MKLNFGAIAEDIEAASKPFDPEKPWVMIVDDERPNLDTLKEILSDSYNVLTASGGADALEQLRQQPENVDIEVIVSDQRMPKMTGVEMFTELCRQQHRASRIILTGYADLGSIIKSVNQAEIYRYLTKPIQPEELHTAVRNGRHRYGMQEDNRRLVAIVKDLLEENSELHKALQDYPEKLVGREGTNLAQREPKRIALAVMFIDVRGFTKLSSQLAPVKVVSLLQALFHPIHGIIYDAGGIVDKHLGDGIMAVFGLGGPSGVSSCVHAAERIVEAMPGYLRSLKEQFGDFGDMRISVGLAAGQVVMGMLGSERRRELAVIGQPANRAARYQEFTKLAFSEEGKRILGTFEHAMAVCDTTMLGDGCGFKKIGLEGLEVRDFTEVHDIGILTS